jgi:DNA-binding NarL/FixJ family response regulator
VGQAAYRILIAAGADGQRAILAHVPRYYVIRKASTLQEAEQQLNEVEFHLILVGIFFDDANMFELLRLIRGSSRNIKTPVICVRSSQSPFSHETNPVVEQALKVLGAQSFIDLSSASSDDLARFRTFLEDTLSGANTA